MSSARKFVMSLYPDAYLIEHIAPAGNRYQVVYDITGNSMPTWYWESSYDAWQQAEERINERILAKLEA